MKNVTTVSILTVIAFILGVIGIVIPLTVYFTNIQYKTDNSYFGNIGDWFGGIAGPILSFSSFLIVYAALRLQSIESKEQKEESQIQQRLSSVKRFEDSFSFLFAQFNQQLKSMSIVHIQHTERFRDDADGKLVKIIDTRTMESEGRRCFYVIIKLIKEKYNQAVNLDNEKQPNDKDKCCCDAFLEVYKDEEVLLNLYFRFFQQVIVYVDHSELISEKEKPFYINLVKSNMSIIENVLLHYHCEYHTEDEFKELRKLAEKYNLTSDLNERFLLQ